MRPVVTDWVAWSVCQSVTVEKNGLTNRDAVWVEDSGGPKEPCIRWRSRSPWEGRGEGRPIVKYRDVRPWAVQKWLNHWDAVMDLDLGAYIGWGCTLAPPGKYHWTVHVWWRCGLLSNYFDQWLHFAWVVDNKRKYISIGRAHLCVCVCPSLHACITARTQM